MFVELIIWEAKSPPITWCTVKGMKPAQIISKILTLVQYLENHCEALQQDICEHLEVKITINTGEIYFKV